MGWVADDFFGAGCVVADAAGLPGHWRALVLAALGGVMEINGVEVGRGVGADIINGHPLEALVWLAAKFSERGETSPRCTVIFIPYPAYSFGIIYRDIQGCVIMTSPPGARRDTASRAHRHAGQRGQDQLGRERRCGDRPARRARHRNCEILSQLV